MTFPVRLESPSAGGVTDYGLRRRRMQKRCQHVWFTWILPDAAWTCVTAERWRKRRGYTASRCNQGDSKPA